MLLSTSNDIDNLAKLGVSVDSIITKLDNNPELLHTLNKWIYLLIFFGVLYFVYKITRFILNLRKEHKQDSLVNKCMELIGKVGGYLEILINREH